MRILFINLPPFLPKKPGNDLYYLQASMNLGMLAVASAAKRAGHDVVAYDWLGPQQIALDEELPAIMDDFDPLIVAFSVPSGYAEPYLRLFAPLVRQMTPHVTIVVGGQYHVGFRAREILVGIPEVDAVVVGAGERIDWSALANGRLSADVGVVTRANTGAVPTRVSVRDLEPLHWNLIAGDIREYAPGVEIGRGCPFTCSFCSLSGAPESLSRGSAESIVAQLAFWARVWDDLPRVPFYAECPVFFCNPRNLAEYRHAFAPFADRLEWRAQARVDSIEPAVFPVLRELGLRVIDLGLESASPRMLRLMNKTAQPDRYLIRAGEFIERAAEAGIGVKLNILLYPGEDKASAAETEDFISHYRHQLAGIAAGSALEFPGTGLSSEMEELNAKYGTQRVVEPVLADSGIYPLDLSGDFSFDAARAWCVRVSRMVMDSQKYFDLKRIGYYPPAVTYQSFLAAANSAPRDALPFQLDGDGSTSQRNQSVAEEVVRWDKLR